MISTTDTDASATHTPATGVRATDIGAIDVGGLLRRVRRLADLSQRDLARLAGVGRATVGRAESGMGRIPAETLQMLLGVVGCRLAVLGPDGQELDPMRGDAIRDNGDRRYPAHLDPRVTSWLHKVGGGLRRDRPLPRLSLEYRVARDRRRKDDDAAHDHPGPDDLRRFHDRERAASARRLAAVPAPPVQTDCECGPECERNCVPHCPCQCEPSGSTAAASGP